MWTRKQVKERGKIRFKANYWKCVLISALVAGIIGGFSFSGSSISFPDSTNYTQKQTITSFSEITTETDMGLIIGYAVIFFLVFITIFALIMALALLLDAFIYNPLSVGVSRFSYLNLQENAPVREAAFGFDHCYKNVAKVMFLREIYTMLWTMLFLIPGIVKSYEYRMIPYLLAENPGMSKEEAFARSKYMMKGNKWKAFVLDLSFIGWYILSLLTAGIVAIFYVAPYKLMTNAALYDAIKFEKWGMENGIYNSGR